MSSVFLFGAGASYGSGPCAPSSPPLGAQLFPALQATGGVAATVDADLAAAFVRDFEVGMDRFWAERNTQTTEFLRDIARFFAPFEPLPGNLYLELLRVLGGTKKKSVMVTTNYDLLIEHAVMQSGLLVTYGGLPAPERNIPILKIHGSCNFLPNLQPRQFSGVSFDLSQSKGGSIIEAEVKPARSSREIIDFCDREDSIAPALAMYSPSKQVLFCKGFIQAQQQAWLTALSAAARIYVIGLRVHLVDEHIWSPLAKARAPIHYVGREPDDFMAWAHISGHRSAYVLANSFEGAIPRIAMHHGYHTKGR
ncbi:MAG: hypothetical protein ACYCTY_08055 [Sulfuricella sp.]